MVKADNVKTTLDWKMVKSPEPNKGPFKWNDNPKIEHGPGTSYGKTGVIPGPFTGSEHVEFGTQFCKEWDEPELEWTNEDLSINFRVRFLRTNGFDMTLDGDEVYEKEIVLKQMWSDQTIKDIKQKIYEVEGIHPSQQRIFCGTHFLVDEVKIGDCYVNWMGFGMEYWPPIYIMKPVPKGTEIVVQILGCRDTAEWKQGKLWGYVQKRLIFDVLKEQTVDDLKKMIQSKIRMPPNRQRLFIDWEEQHPMDEIKRVEIVELEDGRLMGDYPITTGMIVKFMKNEFDENGKYVFDDAFFDENGFHPRPSDSHFDGPQTSEQWRDAVTLRKEKNPYGR